MARTLREVFIEVLNMPADDRLALARKSSKEVLNYLKDKINNKQMAKDIYFLLIGTYVGIDGNIDEKEYQFCAAVFGSKRTFNKFFEKVKSVATPENIEYIDNLIDSSPMEVMAAFVLLGVSICACNGVMTADEQKLLTKYHR